MKGEPRIRAGYVKANLAAAAGCGPKVLGALRAAAPDVIDTIRAAGHGDWLPVDVNQRLVREVRALGGQALLRDWGRRTVFESVEGPLLKPLWRAVVNLFGLTPAMTLRRAPLGWELVYRDCGLLTAVPIGDNALQLRIEGACALFLDDADYVEWIGGAVEAAVDLGGDRGRVEVHVDRSARRVEFDVRW
ncbi:MAG: hypothetical protein HYS27_17865 [Deltaproteobacteria bacterium]|nr:hypothetical protein [Deltaproteobacteria bacterium]